MKIHIRSLGYSVYPQTQEQRELCVQQVRSLVSFKTEILPGGIRVRKPDAFFGGTNTTKSYYAFHINTYQQFISRVQQVSAYQNWTYTVVDHRAYDPNKAEIIFNPEITLRDYQIAAVNFAHEKLKDENSYKNFLLGIQTGKGKAQPLSCKIKTPYGWTSMGETYVGMPITAWDGTHCTVTGVYPQGKEDVYSVVLADGRMTKASANHLWRVYIRDENTIGVAPKCIQNFDLHTTQEIMSKMAQNKQVYLPLPKINVSAEESEDDNVAFSRGLDLGSALLCESEDTASILDDLYRSCTDRYRLYMLLGAINSFTAVFESNFESNSIEFSKNIPKNADDPIVCVIKELAHSVGCIVHFEQGGDDTLCFKISFQNTRALYAENTESIPVIPISSISFDSTQYTRCITIDHIDHLYMTDDYIVTHNTLTSMKIASDIGYTVCAIIKPGYFDKWLADICKLTNTNPNEIWAVKGGSSMRKLTKKAASGRIKHKFIVISNKTYQHYIKDFEDEPDRMSDMGYKCSPTSLLEKAGVGLLLRDEIHQDFHLNYKIDVYSNVKYAMALSATLISKDNFIKEMQSTMFPMSHIYGGSEYDRYVKVNAYVYHLHSLKGIRTSYSQHGFYSHSAFESSLVRDKTRLRNYLNLIKHVIDKTYVVNQRKNKRAIVYCSTVEMCTLVCAYLQRMYPGVDVRRYVTDDEYANLLEPNIVVSTLGSGSTAHDIPDLVSVILTQAVDSPTSNLQALGRLRRLEDDTVLEFSYLVCWDIKKHMDYHIEKQSLLRDKAKTLGILHTGLWV